MNITWILNIQNRDESIDLPQFHSIFIPIFMSTSICRLKLTMFVMEQTN